MTGHKATMTSYGCGTYGHYMNECPKSRNQNRGNQNNGGGARGRVCVLGGGEAVQDLTLLRGNVTSSKSTKIKEVIRMAHNIMDQTVGYLAKNYRILTLIISTTPRASMTCHKATMTSYGCGTYGHYMNESPKSRNQNRGNQNNGGGARGRVCVLGGGEAVQDLTLLR
nr:hypothetical protein [Tanacetum cinerariifolium]